MYSVRGLALAVTVTVCVIVSVTSDCRPSHMQEDVCNNVDFILKVKVLKKEEIPDPNSPGNPKEVKYQVKIRKVFKGDYKVRDKISIYTIGDTGPIALLSVGHVYLINGKDATVNDCGLYRKWKEMSRKQKRQFRRYLKNCSCRINFCFSKQNCNTKEPCTLINDSSYPCYTQHSFCKKDAQGVCGWVKRRKLRKCLKDVKSGSD